MRNTFLMLLCGLTGLAAAAQAADTAPAKEVSASAVILAYHRIGEDEYPDASLRAEQFEEHIRELSSGSYNILPLTEIVAALRNNTALPDNAVAITFEGGYKSILDRAVPLLLEKNIPFTVFYSAGLADNDSTQYMDWSDLKRLSSNKNVTLGLLPASYSRLAGASRETVLSDLNQARIRHREAFGTNATLFSYAFGEYDLAYRTIVEEQEFAAAFGLQSGVAYNGSDLYALPRFTMTEAYGDIERFRMIASALPLPVSNIEPADPYLKNTPPHIGFTVDEALSGNLDSLSCFVSGQNKVAVETVGGRRIELRPAEELGEERIRVNCTLPTTLAGEDTPRWRWFGMMLVNRVETPANPEPAALP